MIEMAGSGHPWFGGYPDAGTRLRVAARSLRRVAEESLVLLAPVISLDDDRTWRSPWQRRCHARIDTWARALAAGARVARERADALDLAAVRPSAALPVGSPPSPPSPPSPSGLGAFTVPGLSEPDLSVPALSASGRPGPVGPVGVRFSVERLAELARRLRTAEGEATGLLRRLGPTGRAAGVCGGLDLVATQAGAMAVAIDHRLARVAAAETLLRAPSPAISPALAPNSPPGTAARDGPGSDLLAELVALIGADPSRLGVAGLAEITEIATGLARLAPDALTAVIGGLRGPPLEALAAAVALAPSRLDLSTLHRLPAVIALGDLLLRHAPPALVREVARLFPGLEPPVVEPAPGWAHSLAPPPPAGNIAPRGHGWDPVWVRGATASDVGQGRLGDCYFLAALLGVVHADPGLVRRNLRENPNGTVTVTLHPGRPSTGGPVEITVTRDLPTDRGGGREIGADADNAEGDPELWPALYEKAYARLAGSYAGIEGGDPAVAMRQLTGAAAVTAAPAGVQVADIASRLAAGDVVTVVTRDRAGATGALVPDHAYTILGADERTGRVLLRNPWDQTPSDDRLDWRRWEEIRPELAGVQYGATGRRG